MDYDNALEARYLNNVVSLGAKVMNYVQYSMRMQLSVTQMQSGLEGIWNYQQHIWRNEQQIWDYQQQIGCVQTQGYQQNWANYQYMNEYGSNDQQQNWCNNKQGWYNNQQRSNAEQSRGRFENYARSTGTYSINNHQGAALKIKKESKEPSALNTDSPKNQRKRNKTMTKVAAQATVDVQKVVKLETVQSGVKSKNEETITNNMTKNKSQPIMRSVILKDLTEPSNGNLRGTHYSKWVSHSLANECKSSISIMQSKLNDLNSNNPLMDDDLIVAKIVVPSMTIITDDILEFIRTDLVGWIGLYQQQGLDIPLFHALTNKTSHISVVCDNMHAYECLEKCITEISKVEKLSNISVERALPSTVVYCYDSIYEGIATDVDLFLMQLHLHRNKLYTHYWVVVKHDVSMVDRITTFTFLIDERSALNLEFYYTCNLCVCTQRLTFRNRGIVKE